MDDFFGSPILSTPDTSEYVAMLCEQYDQLIAASNNTFDVEVKRGYEEQAEAVYNELMLYM